MLDYDLSLVILMELERFDESLDVCDLAVNQNRDDGSVLEQGRKHSSVAAWAAFKIVQLFDK